MYTEYIEELIQVLKGTRIYHANGTALRSYEDGMSCLVDLFYTTKSRNGSCFFIGNGGSAAIASHMTADFMKNGGMKTYSLYDNSVLTCMGNDYGYEHIFSRPLELLAEEGDLLIAISSSGNSRNIINAIRTARLKSTNIITFSGFSPDNQISRMGDYNVHVPVNHFGMTESIHNLMLQQIVDAIYQRDNDRADRDRMESVLKERMEAMNV